MPQARPRVKAFLVSAVEVMAKGDDGLPAVFQATYEAGEQKAALAGVTDFAVQDGEPDLSIETNQEPFEAEDGTYFGPFEATFTVTDPAQAPAALAIARRLAKLRESRGLWPLRIPPVTACPLSPVIPDDQVLAVCGGMTVAILRAPTSDITASALPIVAITETERKRRAELENLKAPTKEVAEDLRSDSMPIRLSAIRVFQRLKDPVSPTLLRAAMTYASPLVSAEAVKALVYQGRADLPEMLIDIVRSVPDDASRLEAARALAKPGDNAHNAILATLLTAKTVRGRQDSVQVFATINTPESRMLAATFLRDVSASVRHAVVSLIEPREEVPAKAILYAGINDISEAVRGVALGRIAAGSDQKRAQEAAVALAADTPSARAFALPYLGQAAVTKALADPSPKVRRKAWSLTAQAVDATETDRDVLREIAIFPGELPPGLNQLIENSTDPLVRILRKRSHSPKPVGSKIRLKS